MKKITKAEAKRIENYLLKARDYILELENKYDEDNLTMDSDLASSCEDLIAGILYTVNNSKY